MEAIPVLQYILEPELLSFYGWWQMSVCMFAFIALMAIWWHIGRRQKDVGQVWLALSVLCWSFSGGVEVYYAGQFQQNNKVVYEKMNELIGSAEKINHTEIIAVKNALKKIEGQTQDRAYRLDSWRSIFSLFNSLFILLSLPWFRYIPKRIEPIIKSKYWHFIIGLPFLFSLLPTISKMFSVNSLGVVRELDVYYAILTLVFLGYVLWESFAKRRLLALAWLSVVCILITFVAQLYKVTGQGVDLTLFSAIFKTSLIMIFFALALSWVKELAENIIPGAALLFLQFKKEKNGNKKMEHFVSIKGIPGKEEKWIKLSTTLFELFLKFAERRKNNGEDWLEIKPKNDSRSGKLYDINDHNEIKRLLNALLDGVFGKNLWTKEKHFLPLKNTLFEMSDKRERKIRLRVPGDNIFYSASS
ncbi:MAG: hypothetical protein AAFZ15_15275 [Bacteroidota bacterium]